MYVLLHLRFDICSIMQMPLTDLKAVSEQYQQHDKSCLISRWAAYAAIAYSIREEKLAATFSSVMSAAIFDRRRR